MAPPGGAVSPNGALPRIAPRPLGSSRGTGLAPLYRNDCGALRIVSVASPLPCQVPGQGDHSTPLDRSSRGPARTSSHKPRRHSAGHRVPPPTKPPWRIGHDFHPSWCHAGHGNCSKTSGAIADVFASTATTQAYGSLATYGLIPSG